MCIFCQIALHRAPADVVLENNVGKNGSQEVMHLHWHLLGGGKIVWEENRK